jgi:hypothetical protein
MLATTHTNTVTSLLLSQLLLIQTGPYTLPKLSPKGSANRIQDDISINTLPTYNSIVLSFTYSR